MNDPGLGAWPSRGAGRRRNGAAEGDDDASAGGAYCGMKATLSSLLVCDLAPFSVTAWTGFSAGLDAYDAGDYETAFREWLPFAEQGDAGAQFALGVMHDEGLGVPQDYREAATWYRRAAEQGHASAMNNVGLMYEFGRGVPQHFVYAHMRLNLAAISPAREKHDMAAKNRDRVAAKMTPGQIAEAQELAREWRPIPSARGLWIRDVVDKALE